MSNSLETELEDRGAEFSDYRGARTARSFGDFDVEYEALRTGAALLDFSHRRALVAEGCERAQFLHGQLTQDVNSLGPGEGAPALVLTPQGRPLAMFVVHDLGGRLLLSVDVAALETARLALERFLVADDVEFLDIEPSLRFAIAGPSAPRVLADAGIDGALELSPWGAADGEIGGQPVTVLASGELDVPLFEIVVGPVVGKPADDEEDDWDDEDDEDDDPDEGEDGDESDGAGRPVRLGRVRADGETDGADADAAAVWRALEEAGARPVGTDALEAVRVESGTAAIGVDIDESRVALEARLEWAIHFAKGCYVGQEIIERVVSRGGLNRELALVRLDLPVEIGAVRVGGGAQETLTSVVRSPRLGTLGFVYVSADGLAVGDRIALADAAGVEVAAEVLEWPRARALAGRNE